MRAGGAMIRALWGRVMDWYTWRLYRAAVYREAKHGVADQETEAMAAGTRCPDDLEPCACKEVCVRHGHDADTVAEYRGKHVWVGRMAAALRRVAFHAGDAEPEIVRRAEEAERLLADLRRDE